jgi:hypothetical protein
LTQRAGPARNEIASAMSAGSPSRSRGDILAKFAMVASSLPLRNSGVATGPGPTALTVMSRPRSSRARISVMPSTADLLATYAA